MWTALGFPSEWQEDREAALLDRGNELMGLSIDSDTTDDET